MFSIKASITDIANEVEQLGFDIEASYGEATVTIRNTITGEAEVTLTGEAAIDFIENAQDCASEARVDLNTAMLADARSYINSL